MKEGDIFESLLDGTEYVVKDIVNKMVVLQSRKGDRQILTDAETLKTKLFYREKENKVNQWNKKEELLPGVNRFQRKQNNAGAEIFEHMNLLIK